MAKKYIDQDEAAKMLGVSVEELSTMREQRKVHGMRDGGMWKFKPEDVERAKQEMDDSAGSSGASLDLDDDLDSILLSESSLGGPASGTSATVIGKNTGPAQSDSDLKLASDSDIGIEPPDSDVKLAPNEASGIELAGSSDLQLAESGRSRGSDSGKSASDELDLEEEDDDDDLTLADSVLGTSSSVGSQLQLAEEDRGSVLGSKPDSDVTIGGGDSGISLVDPADSGLSLDEEPADLVGSAVKMLDLGEGDVISLEEETDRDAATQLKSEEDFLLTPLDDAGVDESDSGSQVIALDADDDFASAGNMFGSSPGVGSSGAMLEEESSPEMEVEAGFGAAPGAVPAGAMMMAPTVPEAPYSMWNVLALVCCALFLMLAGMMMYDLVRHMWSWDQPYAVNSTIMDGILGLVEGK